MHIHSLLRIISPLLLFALAVLALPGCGRDMTPQGPKPGELEEYLATNPEGLEVEDVVEPEDGGDDGSGE